MIKPRVITPRTDPINIGTKFTVYSSIDLCIDVTILVDTITVLRVISSQIRAHPLNITTLHEAISFYTIFSHQASNLQNL